MYGDAFGNLYKSGRNLSKLISTNNMEIHKLKLNHKKAKFIKNIKKLWLITNLWLGISLLIKYLNNVMIKEKM